MTKTPPTPKLQIHRINTEHQHDTPKALAYLIHQGRKFVSPYCLLFNAHNYKAPIVHNPLNNTRSTTSNLLLIKCVKTNVLTCNIILIKNHPLNICHIIWKDCTLCFDLLFSLVRHWTLDQSSRVSCAGNANSAAVCQHCNIRAGKWEVA